MDRRRIRKYCIKGVGWHKRGLIQGDETCPKRDHSKFREGRGLSLDVTIN